MRIAQIGSYPLDVRCIQGGVETSVYGLATELALTEEVFVFDLPRATVKQDSVLKDKRLTVYRFSSAAGSNYAALWRIKSFFRAIKGVRPSVCHLHTSGLFQLVLYITLRLYKIPLVVTIHGLAHIEKQKEWRKTRQPLTLVKYIVQSVTEFIFLSICPVVIVDTPYVADTIGLYKSQRKLLRAPVCNVIPQGIDARFFQIESSATNQYRVLSVGALSPRKGHVYLIEAIKEALSQIPTLSLIIVGASTNPTYLQLLNSKIYELGLTEHVVVLPNAPVEQILDLYKVTSLFALYSEEESQGVVFCEAMAAGLPIVATNVGGIPWIVDNGENGLLSDFSDVKQFAESITSLLADDKLLRRMSEANRLKAPQFSWNNIAREVHLFYKTVSGEQCPTQ